MPKDQLKTFPTKIYRLILKNILYIIPSRYREKVAHTLISLYFRSDFITTKRSDGRWVCLIKDETGKILEGADHKRFNKNNFYPVMRQFVVPGTVAIDVGTSYGDEVIELSDLVGIDGLVYAIEPHPRYFEALQRTISLNKIENVICLNKAVGAKIGSVTAISPQDYYYLKGRETVYQEEISSLGTPCITLDSLLPEIDSKDISFIKIDTDGFELEVIRGATKILERFPKCQIVAEFIPHTDYSGYKDAELFKHYRDLGFCPGRIQMTWTEIKPDDDDYVVKHIGNPLHMMAHDIVLRSPEK